MTKKRASTRADAFSSLLGSVSAVEGPQTIDVDRVSVRPGQPRRHFDEDGLEALTSSVRAQGILQPILVRPVEGGYELIAGERRLRAARQAGLTEIPATVREVADEDTGLLAALENLQRQDLNPLDEVEATVKVVAQLLGVGETEVVPLLHAQRRAPDAATVAQLDTLFQQLGRGGWASFAANKSGVLKFPADLLTLMRAGKLEYTRASALAKVKDPATRKRLTRRTLSEGLSVREIGQAARGADAGPERYKRVRSLIDEQRISRLGQGEQARVKALLDELEALLQGDAGKSKRRS